MRELVAWIADKRVGTFSESPTPDGGSLFTFEYESSATTTDLVSLTMVPLPLQRRFELRSFPAPFDMILPEGERRARIEAARKIMPTDPFSLLSYVGANPVNRVRFLLPDTEFRFDAPALPTPREIADCTDGLRLFNRLMGELDLRQGVAGVQPKILGDTGAIGRKLSNDRRHQRGSTHILKSSPRPYPYLATNEFVCLRVFEAAGLCTPRMTLSADGRLLLVERFDRQEDGRHSGFEEVGVLMGETAATKYQRDYGSMVETLADTVSPALEDSVRRDLVKAIVLNHLIGNGDAHLKNFGVLYTDDLDVRLAPFYDCVSTLPYIPDDVPALALSNEHYAKSWWPRMQLEDFARHYGRMGDADIDELLKTCMAAVSQGLAILARQQREIPGFRKLAMQMKDLWQTRLAQFTAEASSLKSPRQPRKRPRAR